MPINRLRNILSTSYEVVIDSSNDTIRRVLAKVAQRAAARARGGRRGGNARPKSPAAVATLANTQRLMVRPIDLLRKLGELTTPPDVNMAKLNASWATRRYFWAISEPQGRAPKFRLSEDARKMDFHQKTLLSDEFGIGFGGFVLERLFGAYNSVDVSTALKNPSQYQNIRQTGSAQPDYLMWSRDPNTPYYVV